MQYVALACRCALAVVFLVAVLGKLRGAAAFRSSVRDLVGGGSLVSAVVVLTEAACVVLLVIPRTAPAGFVLAGAVLLAFYAVIARAVRSGVRTPCRCFGTSASPLSTRHLIRNAGLLAVTLAGGAAQVVSAGQAHPAGVAIALAGAGVLALTAISFDDLADLLAGPAGR